MHSLLQESFQSMWGLKPSLVSLIKTEIELKDFNEAEPREDLTSVV